MASINCLPAEIFLSILHFVGNGPELIPFVTVSRYWQLTIEQVSGSFKRLSIQNFDLSKFAGLFRPAQAHRRALVVTIHFAVILWPCQENQSQRFSDAILQLFQVLQVLFNDDKSLKKCDGIFLGIGAAVSSGYVQLLNHTRLPTLSCVSSFYCGNDRTISYIDPVSTMLIASKLDGLESCTVRGTFDSQNATLVKRRAIRQALATTFSHYTGPLKRLYIDIKWIFLNDKAAVPLDIIVDASREDSLNTALRELIQRGGLSEVSILLDRGYIVSPEFFWPYGETQVRPMPTIWSNLEVLRMHCSPATPDGAWYFLADEKIATCMGFAFPNSKKMNPLLASIARAVQSAPSIRKLTLSFGPEGLSPTYLMKEAHLERDFEICYTAPGAKARKASASDKPRLELRVKDWRPSEMVERLWRDALGLGGEIVYH